MTPGLKGLTVLRGQKECRCCHKMLPLRMFNHDSKGADGFSARCRMCTTAAKREYYRELCQDTERHERYLKKMRDWREKNRKSDVRTRPDVPDEMNYCPRCKRILPVSEFDPTSNRRSKTGLQGYCKGCCRDYAKQRLQRIKSSPALHARWLERKKSHREQNKENDIKHQDS